MYDINTIFNSIPHRYPFLLLDRILEHDPATNIATGIKCVTMNEQHFVGHFPNDPVMPGVLIIESLAQLATMSVFLSLEEEARRHKSVYLVGIDKAKFRKPVIPGDVLYLHAAPVRRRNMLSIFKCHATTDGDIACEAEISAVMRDI